MKAIAGYGLYIKMLSDLLERNANRNMRSLGLTFSQHKVLRLLASRPDHTAPLKFVESEFQSAQSTVAGLAARLEKKGLVTALQDDSDRRVKIIRITEEGLTLNESSRQDMLDTEDRLVAALSPEERVQLLDFLQRMYASLQESTPAEEDASPIPNPSQKGRNQC